MLASMTAPSELELIARLALAVALGAVLGLDRETRRDAVSLLVALSLRR